MRRLVLALALAGCSASMDSPGGGGAATDLAAAPSDGGGGGDLAVSGGSDGGGLVPGSLAVSWMHGAQNCSASTDPDWQLHAYNASTYILRQSKCSNFEAPFVYLLLGTQQALLLDTGATSSSGLHDQVMPLLNGLPLLVAHTHAHGDHIASDARFTGQPNTTVVAHTVSAVSAQFGLNPWPTGTSTLDLGNRVLDVLAIPGHEVSHIALYDRQTGILLTGDTLYPGLLFINDWTAYRDSVARLAAFAAARPVSHVLGAHIEMTSTPQVNYPYGTTYQPMEHVLQLEASHLMELNAALVSLGPNPPTSPVAHDDFVIDPQ
jgi:glyoxylase-like metal-dependent hydrolase (beta-lactamase superfamily II)